MDKCTAMRMAILIGDLGTIRRAFCKPEVYKMT